jgi:hypothetical protein
MADLRGIWNHLMFYIGHFVFYISLFRKTNKIKISFSGSSDRTSGAQASNAQGASRPARHRRQERRPQRLGRRRRQEGHSGRNPGNVRLS